MNQQPAHRTEIRTVVTFQNPSFNSTEPRDYFINDCCFGDDVAHSKIEQLRSRGVHADPEPKPEDWGWYFFFCTGEMDYQFEIGFRPADGSDPGVWIGTLKRKTGLVGYLLGARKYIIQPLAARLVHSVISNLPDVHDIRWHTRQDFEAGKEELGTSTPEA